MRILHVTRTYYPDSFGGIEEVIRQICLYSRLEGVESRIFTLSQNPNPKIIQREEAEVFRSQYTFSIASCDFSIWTLSNFKELVEWADIIHYHFPWPFADLLHFIARVKKKSIITYHSDVVRQKMLYKLYQPLMTRFLESVSTIVATSDNYTTTSKVLCKYNQKIEVIPIGIDEKSYPVPLDGDLASMENKTGKDFFLFIGTLRLYKGLNVLLDAVKGTNLRCVIAGTGPVEQELKKQAKRQSLTGVQFLGKVDDVEKVVLIKLCRAVVFSSCLRSEAFGVSLVEGLMFAKPLISTDLGTGTSFVNVDEKTGLVVPPLNVEALRKAMKCLAGNSILTDKMGKAARIRYEKLFTGSRMGKKYLRVYNELLQS